MIAALRVGARLTHRQGRAGGRDLALTALGVALPLGLIIILAGVLSGLGQREDRSAWREPVSAQGRPTFVHLRSGDAFAGEPIDRVDLAPVAAPAGTAEQSRPVPPGLPTFPAAGEVWISPALADVIGTHPETHLIERWPGSVVGVIGEAGLARPDELVVVVGHAAGGLTPTEPTTFDRRNLGPFDPSAALATDRLSTSGKAAGVAFIIAGLAVIGAVLLLVPALQLSAAAARFTTNRRAVRLAALRLAGATPGQILAMAALEAAVASALGALGGMAVVALLLG